MADQDNNNNNNNNNNDHPPKNVVICDNDFGSKDGSAATIGTSQSPPSGQQQHTVIVQPLPSGNEEDSNTSSNARRRLVTTHRKTLEYITTDSFQNTRYAVPDQKQPRKRWVPKTVDAIKGNVTSKGGMEWLEIFLPMTKWLRSYSWKDTLLQDFIAGCTVGVMVVPQSMSYAKLAGLPVEYGLYSALVPVYAYAMFGSSRQLAVGPVALISLLLSTGLTHVMEKLGLTRENTPDYQERYNQMAIQVSFMVGLMYIALGLLRLGFVTIFLSHAVVSGFTTGAAVIIGLSQVKYLFGYDIPKSDVLHEVIENIIAGIDQFNYKTFLVGGTGVLVLLAMKHIGKTYPKLKWVRAAGPLTVCVVAIVLNVIFDLESKGIPVVGAIPKGLPTVTTDVWFPMENADKLMVLVFSITIVGFMESIAIGKQLASKHKYELDSSLELIGLGMANFCGAIFNSYPVTGSFSRSAVNNESGAQSGISGFVTATIVGLVLLFMTTVFEKMPLAILASIVISGVLGLLDYEEAMYLWKVHKFDFGVWIVACFGTMFLGVEIGLAIAVGVSLLLVTYESAYPHTAVLGRLPGTTVYRNVKQYPEAERYDGIVMVRVDAPIYFANTQNVREKIAKYEMQAEQHMAETNGSIKYVVLELSPVSHVDTSALHILADLNKTYRDRGVKMCICNPSVQVMDKFVLSGLADDIGRQHIFASIHDCVNWCLDEMDNVEVSLHGDGDGQLPEDSVGSKSVLSDVEMGTRPTGVILSATDVESELREEMEISGSQKNTKISFASIGTGQL